MLTTWTHAEKFDRLESNYSELVFVNQIESHAFWVTKAVDFLLYIYWLDK